MSSLQGDKQEAILDAAYTLFGSNGFYETKMSAIAQQAGIAKGTIYLYFKSKEELFVAVTKRDCSSFLQRLKHELKNCSDVPSRIAYIARHHLRYYYECRNHTNLFFMAPNNDPELIAYMQQFMEDYMRMVVAVLEESGGRESELYAQSYIGMLDRLKMDILFKPDFDEQDLERRIQFAANLFTHGFISSLPEEQRDGSEVNQ